MYIVKWGGGERNICEQRIRSDVFVVFLKAFVLSLRIADFWPSSEPGIS